VVKQAAGAGSSIRRPQKVTALSTNEVPWQINELVHLSKELAIADLFENRKGRLKVQRLLTVVSSLTFETLSLFSSYLQYLVYC